MCLICSRGKFPWVFTGFEPPTYRTTVGQRGILPSLASNCEATVALLHIPFQRGNVDPTFWPECYLLLLVLTSEHTTRLPCQGPISRAPFVAVENPRGFEPPTYCTTGLHATQSAKEESSLAKRVTVKRLSHCYICLKKNLKPKRYEGKSY